jgi:anti-anti-sigma regulatory factor
MTRMFDLTRLRDVPTPGQDAVLLSARVDLDLATRDAVRAEMLDAVAEPAHALVLDLTGVFVGAVAVRDLVALIERATRTDRPIAVVGAPHWFADLATRLDIPPVRSAGTVADAVRSLRVAAGPATPATRR